MKDSGTSATEVLEAKVADFFARHGHIEPEGCLVAYSGGIDSSVLLDILVLMGRKPARAVYINHNLRSAAELDREWETVQAFCSERSIEISRVTVRSGAIHARARGKGVGTEAAAREFRYRILAREATRLGLSAILTAHQEDDVLETLLFRMLRGSGLDGLKGIAETRSLAPGLDLIRPFLEVSRSLIEACAVERNLAFADDSTNSEDEYARNRLRHILVPVLDTGFPGWRKGLSATRSALESDAQALKGAIASLVDGIGTDSTSIPLAEFRKTSPALRQRIVGCLLSGSGSKAAYSRAALASIAESLNRGAAELRFRDRVFRTATARIECLPALDFRPEHGYFFMMPSEGTYRVGSLEASALWSANDDDSLHGQDVDCRGAFLVEGSFDFPLIVRTKMPGDRIRNSKGSSMVDEILKSWNLESGARESVPIVEDRRGIVAVLPGSMESPPTEHELHRHFTGPLSGRRLFIRVKGA